MPRSLVLLLPTCLTLARLFAVPVAVWQMLMHHFDVAFVIFVAAGISDALDGAIARLFDARTELGAYLDPVADKVLLVSVFVMLGIGGQLPSWLVILVVFRDVLIIGGVLLFHAAGRSPAMDPLFISKLNTACQIVLAGWVLAHAGWGFDDWGLTDPLIWAVAATTFASGAAYVAKWGNPLIELER